MMELHKDIAKMASLIGDNSRAKMLTLLMAGKALTAGELARGAEISAQTASNHLLKLTEANIIQCRTFGRYRYYSLSSNELASLLESMGVIADTLSSDKVRKKSIDKSLCHARTCYDHLAGKVAVNYTRILLNRELLIKGDSDFDVTEEGKDYFCCLGIDLVRLREQKRVFAKQCLDWTERECHIAGSLGAAILTYMLDNRLMIKSRNQARGLVLTRKGQVWFRDQQ